MTAWRQNTDLAVVEATARRVYLNLSRPLQPPIILEGAALAVIDAVDGTRDTLDLLEHLAAQHPQVSELEAQVRRCVDELSQVGLIVANTDTEPS